MPKGIYKRIIGINNGLNKGLHWKIKNTSKYKGGKKGRHWKIKDTSKMKGHHSKTEFKKGQSSRAKGKHWKIKDTSKMKGHIAWNKNLKMSEEFREGARKRAKGNKNTLGKHWKVKDTSKMRAGAKNCVNSGRFKKGRSTWNKNRIETRLEIIEKLRKSHTGKTGKLASNWQGGISFEPYPLDWTNDLRESIRKRDNYICQECGIHQDELKGFYRKLDIHHIDYDKDNLNPNNLISLCKSCHVKTNFNRKYWIEYFNKFNYGRVHANNNKNTEE